MLITSDGVRLWTASGGRGIHVSLSHGGPGLWDYLQPFARQLEPFATIHRWDQRGGGRSDRCGPYTVARFVADMEYVRAGAGASRWVAGGHSWGGSLALAYAATYPDRVMGVLYIAGTGIEWKKWFPRYREELSRRLGGLSPDDLALLPEAESNRRRWTTDFASPESATSHVQRMLDAGFSVNLEANRSVQMDFERGVPDLVENLRRFDKPVLIIQGALDPRPLQAVDSLIDVLPAALVRRVIVDGAGHFPWAEQPNAVQNEISRWLRELCLETGSSEGA